MLKPIRKSAFLPASLLLAALVAAPANADSFRGDAGGSKDHVAVNEFQVADNGRHGRDRDDHDDHDGWRGRDRDHWRDRHDDRRGPVVVIRPTPRYFYPAPRYVYPAPPVVYSYPRRSYYGDPGASFFGAFAGAVVGGLIGSSMNTSDHAQAAYALENSRVGYRTEWRNPDLGYDYAIVPTRTFQTGDGQFCREYTTWGRIGGREQQLYGQACRMPDGSWRLAS